MAGPKAQRQGWMDNERSAAEQPFLEDHARCSQVLYWADWQVKTAQPAAKAYRKQAEKVMTQRLAGSKQKR